MVAAVALEAQVVLLSVIHLQPVLPLVLRVLLVGLVGLVGQVLKAVPPEMVVMVARLPC
jgi:hypothetical protein